MIQEIQNRKQFDKVIAELDEPVMILFYTDKSEKSQQALENLEKVDSEAAENSIYKLNARIVSDVHPRYNVTTVPTVITFRGGRPSEFTYGVQSPEYYQRLLQHYSAPVNTEDGTAPANRVTVYTTPTCPYCTQVKRYLDSHNVTYSEVDVASDQAAAQELVSRTGQQGVPQTEINGQYVIGYNTAEIDRLLNL